MKRVFCLILAVLLFSAYFVNTVVACADSNNVIKMSSLSKNIKKGDIKRILGKPELDGENNGKYTWLRYKNIDFCDMYCSLVELYFRPSTDTLMQVYIETEANSYNEEGIYELVRVLGEKYGRPKIDTDKSSDSYIWDDGTTTCKYLVIRSDAVVLVDLYYDWYTKIKF